MSNISFATMSDEELKALAEEKSDALAVAEVDPLAAVADITPPAPAPAKRKGRKVKAEGEFLVFYKDGAKPFRLTKAKAKTILDLAPKIGKLLA